MNHDSLFKIRCLFVEMFICGKQMPNMGWNISGRIGVVNITSVTSNHKWCPFRSMDCVCNILTDWHRFWIMLVLVSQGYSLDGISIEAEVKAMPFRWGRIETALLIASPPTKQVFTFAA